MPFLYLFMSLIICCLFLIFVYFLKLPSRYVCLALFAVRLDVLLAYEVPVFAIQVDMNMEFLLLVVPFQSVPLPCPVVRHQSSITCTCLATAAMTGPASPQRNMTCSQAAAHSRHGTGQKEERQISKRYFNRRGYVCKVPTFKGPNRTSDWASAPRFPTSREYLLSFFSPTNVKRAVLGGSLWLFGFAGILCFYSVTLDLGTAGKRTPLFFS